MFSVHQNNSLPIDTDSYVDTRPLIILSLADTTLPQEFLMKTAKILELCLRVISTAQKIDDGLLPVDVEGRI